MKKFFSSILLLTCLFFFLRFCIVSLILIYPDTSSKNTLQKISAPGQLFWTKSEPADSALSGKHRIKRPVHTKNKYFIDFVFVCVTFLTISSLLLIFYRKEAVFEFPRRFHSLRSPPLTC